MNARTHAFLAGAVVVAGFLGGVCANHFSMGTRTAFADKKPSPWGIVTAHEFRLVDSNERLRAKLSLEMNARPGLVLIDENGKERLKLGLDDAYCAPYLKFNGMDGMERASITIVYDYPYLNLSDHKGTTRISLNLARSGREPTLELFDSSAIRRLALVLSKLGGPSLQLFDKKKQRRCVLELRRDDSPALALFGQTAPRGAKNVFELSAD